MSAGRAAAADAGVWPTTAVADAAGVLRVGGTGNDVETLDRFLIVDARGDDTYHNNGGGGFVRVFAPQTSRPVAVAIDLSGNDTYWRPALNPAFGAGTLALGLLYEMSGNDHYQPTTSAGSAGFASIGVGIFRDVAGDDYHFGFGSFGYSNAGLGYYRDDEGDDHYRAWFSSGGYAENSGTAIMWERSGQDRYLSSSGTWDLWGYERNGGRGWFIDETSSIDSWQTLSSGAPHPLACNDCTWIAGTAGGGRGNDNRGGLAYLVAKQDP